MGRRHSVVWRHREAQPPLPMLPHFLAARHQLGVGGKTEIPLFLWLTHQMEAPSIDHTKITSPQLGTTPE